MQEETLLCACIKDLYALWASILCVNEGEYLNHFWVIVQQNLDEKKSDTLATAHSCIIRLLRGFWATKLVLLIIEVLKEEG